MKKSVEKEQNKENKTSEEVVEDSPTKNSTVDAADEIEADKENDTEDSAVDGAAEDSEEQEPDEIGKLKQDLLNAHDALLRKTAEFENFRKRMLKEKSEAEKFASERLIKSLLPVLDNLGRALTAATGTDSFDALLEGVTLTKDQFIGVLTQHGVGEIESTGTPFDPSLHEALQMVETSDHPEDMVIEEFEKGYTMHKRVIRPSKVIVAKKMSEPEAEECAAETDSV